MRSYLNESGDGNKVPATVTCMHTPHTSSRRHENTKLDAHDEKIQGKLNTKSKKERPKASRKGDKPKTSLDF